VVLRQDIRAAWLASARHADTGLAFSENVNIAIPIEKERLDTLSIALVLAKPNTTTNADATTTAITLLLHYHHLYIITMSYIMAFAKALQNFLTSSSSLRPLALP